MIGFLHFAVLHDELYVLGPPMPDWVNGLYFLTLAEIQEVRAHPDAPTASCVQRGGLRWHNCRRHSRLQYESCCCLLCTTMML